MCFWRYTEHFYEEYEEVREECAEAPGRIASAVRDKRLLEPAVGALIKALGDEREATGDFVAGALDAIGTAEARAILKSRRCINWCTLRAGVD